MFSASNWLRTVSRVMPFLLVSSAFAFVVDDDVPDVTARVARISYVDDDVQIKHAGSDDWEKAAVNLPLMEGDEISTSAFAKLEIQFDSRTFVRVQEKSLLHITTLQDSGIALSLPQGTMTIRVFDFSKDKSYFEVDIPNTTVALQRSGVYRIDSGDKDSAEARIRVTDGGEARVYSDTSGFTIKNGRAATIYLTGSNAGEWENFDASVNSDSFDSWTADRDNVIAKRLDNAYYDKYYDRDIYGAEDLNDYGDWVYSRNYGYVWRPFRFIYPKLCGLVAISIWTLAMAAAYGWTWVNDESWGWATYHFGRWVWDDGAWSWTPYGYYRYHRSWWQPALVVLNVIGNDICWYPLPYRSHYYNYNWNHHHNGSWGGDRKGPRVPIAAPTQNTGTTIAAEMAVVSVSKRRLSRAVPPGGVVMVGKDEFGRGRTAIRRPTVDVARTVLSRDPDTIETPPILPRSSR